jgi:hypothetical protein
VTCCPCAWQANRQTTFFERYPSILACSSESSSLSLLFSLSIEPQDWNLTRRPSRHTARSGGKLSPWVTEQHRTIIVLLYSAATSGNVLLRLDLSMKNMRLPYTERLERYQLLEQPMSLATIHQCMHMRITPWIVQILQQSVYGVYCFIHRHGDTRVARHLLNQ